VQKALEATEQTIEFDQAFLWKKNEVKARVKYRGLRGRKIQDISRTEIASVLDQDFDKLRYSDDPLIAISRKLGLSRLAATSREYLNKVFEWYVRENMDN